MEDTIVEFQLQGKASFQNVETFVLTIFFICYVLEFIAKHQRPVLASLYKANTQWSLD